MDLDMKVAEFFAIFCQWQEDHPVEAEEVRFEFLEASNTTLNFRAKDMLFQLLLPTGLLEGDADPNEAFIAMSLDNSAPDSLIVSLNEKLERVPISSRALPQGLDVMAKALINFEGKRKRQNADKGLERPNGKGLLHDSSTIENADDEDEEMHSNHDSDSDTSPEDDGLAHCSKGYVHDMIREARDRCQAARQRSVDSFFHIPVKPTFSEPDIVLYVQDILQFCHVSNRSDFQVKIKAEVAGFVNDVKIASSLGLSCSAAMQIFLEFDRRDSHKPLALSRVTVNPSADFSNAHDATRMEKEEESDEKFEKECKKFRGRQTTMPHGTSVLLPELIQTFFKYRSRETCARPIPWENENLDQALHYFSSLDNPFIGLICFVGSQLKALPSWCIVCWSLLPTAVSRLSTCQNDFCLYEFEEVGLGATLHHEIQASPEVVELELALASAAASSERDVFEPFPSFFLQSEELRGRSGWFTGPSKPSRWDATTTTAITTTTTSTGWSIANVPASTKLTTTGWSIANLPASTKLTTTGWSIANVPASTKLTVVTKIPYTSSDEDERPTDKHNKRLSHLFRVLQSIPKIETLRESVDEDALKRKLSKEAFSIWRNKDPEHKSEPCQMWLSYDLMKFILSTNRSSLRVLKGEEKLGLSLKPTFQFVVLHDSPEKEAIFNRRRAANGSFFAFHGSGFGNWYSILRNGLRPMSNTKFMSTGAAHGKGIYLADNLSLSHQYATRATVVWKNGILKEGTVVIAICEVIIGSAGPVHHSSIYVVPFGQEDNISVRYLLVMNGSDLGISWPTVTIKGNTLRDSGEVNLREKYEGLTATDQMRQHQSLLDERMAAFVRIKENTARPEIEETQLVDNKSPSSASSGPFSSALSGSEGESPTSKHGDYITLGDSTDILHTHGPPMFKRVKENNSVNTIAATHTLRKTNVEKKGGEDTKPPSTGTDQGAAIKFWRDGRKMDSADSRPAWPTPAKKDSAGAKPALPATATQAITKEFKNVQKEIRKSREGTSSAGGLQNESFLANITIEIPNEADVSVWNVNLSQNLFTSYPKLYKDLQKLAASKRQPESSVVLEVTFPGSYPFEPPFVRVVHPKFVFHTGHVTVGGSICMELLTAAGWLPSFSFESVLVQIVNAFIEGEGRVDTNAIGQEYSKDEAQKAFTRVAALHGWNNS